MSAPGRRRFTRDQRTIIVNGMLVFVLIVIVLQLWLLTATMNAWLGGDDAIEQLAAVRAETEGAIGVGGATLATELLRAGLLDELLLATHPTILGFGRTLFDDDLPVDLDLLEQRTFEQGVTLHRYAVRYESEEL